MNTAPVVNQMTLYGRFVVHCFFKIWLERSFQGAVNIEIVLESYLRVHWSSVHHLRVHGGGVHGAGGVGNCPAGDRPPPTHPQEWA